MFAIVGPILLLYSSLVNAQNKTPKQVVRCGTTLYYNQLFQDNPSFKARFAAAQQQLALHSRQFKTSAKVQGLDFVDTIPLVIHVLGTQVIQAQVTDAVIQSQIDVLNEDYQGKNADSVRIPAAFKPLYGKSRLVFQLAKANQYGEPSSGITRTITNTSYSSNTVDKAKFTVQGGADAWDPNQFLNIWVVNFGTSDILGVSIFPGDPRPLAYQGFVCDYRAFGRGASYLFPKYNKGRTTTHELGHFFNLYHIWGDDNGSCQSSDFPGTPMLDDTPNQADATYGNPYNSNQLIITDNCSPAAPGIMYQNFMDYSDDSSLLMFTSGQQIRMEDALSQSPDRFPLLNSTTYITPRVFVRDARITKFVTPAPASTQCAALTPTILVRNSGTQPLTNVQITSILDGGQPVVFNWSGNIAAYSDATVQLPGINVAAGSHTLKVYTNLPNGLADERTDNDTAISNFTVPPILPLNGTIIEGFNVQSFPPANWQVKNPDNGYTWQRNANIGRNRVGSAWVNDYNNNVVNGVDDLVMPNYSIENVDSVFLKFNVAAASYSNPLSTIIPLDTLSILLTKDCGSTYTTLYKKWGASLQTTADSTKAYTEEFFPTTLEWRRDSINLTPYLNNTEAQFQLVFRFNSNFENNVFLDDISVNSVTLPPLLKQQGYLILPTAFNTQFSIWHYRQPTNLRYVNIYTATGQLVWQQQFNGNANTFITVNLPGQPAGVYFVKLGYTDPGLNVTQRIVKY